MQTTIEFDYIDPDHSEFSAEINLQVNELFHSVTQSIDWDAMTADKLISILDKFHQLMVENVSHERRQLFAYGLSPQYKQSDQSILTLKNIAAYVHECGFHANAKIAQQCFDQYLLAITQLTVALDVCDEETIKRCMRKKNSRQQLQKKIDQGVLRVHGSEYFQKFVSGVALSVDPYLHAVRQERAGELAAYYYDLREFINWRRAVNPVYYIFIHPRLIDDAFAQFVKALRLKILRKDDPLNVIVWAYCEFIEIHRYVDGNGRVARVLLNLILASYGLSPLNIASNNGRILEYCNGVLFYQLALQAQKARYNPYALTEFLRSKLAE